MNFWYYGLKENQETLPSLLLTLNHILMTFRHSLIRTKFREVLYLQTRNFEEDLVLIIIEDEYVYKNNSTTRTWKDKTMRTATKTS